MRFILIIFGSLTISSLIAQAHLPISNSSYGFWQPVPSYYLLGDHYNISKKWRVDKFAAVSAGYGYFNGVGNTFLSVPIGVQLSHPLNNNLIAFAGASVAPTLFNVNNPSFYHSYPAYNLSNPYRFGVDAKMQMGLMYINDDRTFSISGSIGVERSSYPVYPVQRPVRNKQ